jgi:plasmid maintenance system antidote protein VapI
MLATMDTFTDWLQKELSERGWRKADLAHHAGVSTAAISDIFTGRRNIGTELATNIAAALGVPAQDVFMVAGILPLQKDRDPEVEQIIHEVENLSKDEKREFLSYIRWQNNQRKKRK